MQHHNLPCICGVTLYSPRGQCILMILAASQEIGGTPSKDECLAFISERRWFKKDLRHDLEPYPGNSNKEPRWKTLFAWARSDAADYECISRHEHGHWPITSIGKDELKKHLNYLRSGAIFRLQALFLASLAFKRFIRPGYQETENDIKRPESIYEDDGRFVTHNLFSLIARQEMKKILGDL